MMDSVAENTKAKLQELEEDAGQTVTEAGKQRALCDLDVEEVGFSWGHRPEQRTLGRGA